MLEFYPAEAKKKFVNLFIREAILNTSSANFYFLEELISRKENELKIKNGLGEKEIKEKKGLEKEDIKEIVKDYYDKSPRERVRDYFRKTGDEIGFDVDFEKYDGAGKEIEKKEKTSPKKQVVIPRRNIPNPFPARRVLRVPEGGHGLPLRFRNLKPVRENQAIDLGNLNPLLNDPNVVSIECQGAGTSIFVSGSMGRKPTNILLSKEEIDEIIDTFSKNAKIPIEEGLFKVAYGGLVLTATVSSSGSNFIIKKI
jgi:hypothetical protein